MLRAKLSKFIKRNKNELLFISAYTITVGALSVYRYYTGQTNAWDLGIFQQALYSFAFHARLFYYTPEIFFKNPSGLFFGVHFSLLMFPLGIFYRLLPYAQALLFLQSFVTAIAIVPLRQICAFAGFKNKDLISFLYLVNPLTIFSNLFDFHLEAFMPLFFLFLVLSLLNEDVLRTIVFSFATFSVYEDGAIMVLAAIFFVVLLKQKIYMMMFRDLLKTNLNSPGVRFLAVLFFLGISSFL